MADFIPPYGTDPGTPYHNGDPIPGSVPPAEFFQKWQTWLLAIVDAAGLVRDAGDDGQLVAAINALIAAGGFSIPALPAHAGAAADADQLALAVDGVHRRISVADLFTGRAGFDQVARDMAMIVAFQQMIAAGTAAGVFADWAGVNTFPTANLPTATGAVWDSVNKTYGNSPTYSADILPVMTGSTTGGYTITAPIAISGGEAWRLGDNNGSTAFDINEGTAVTVTITLPSTAVARIGIRASSSMPDRSPKSFVINRWTGSAWTAALTVASSTGWVAGEVRYFDIPAVATTQLQIVISSIDGGHHVAFAELELFTKSSVTNMVLVDSAVTVPAVPLDGRVFILQKFVSGGVLNADIKAFMARDGSGAGGWVQGALSVQDAFIFDTGFNLLVADFDLSGLPSGTHPLVKVETYNTVEQQIRAIGAIAS